MPRFIMLCVLSLLISSCANTAVIDSLEPKAMAQNPATVWADNGFDYFLMIKKIDGKRVPGTVLGGSPYSAYLLPGTHRISLYVSDVSGSDWRVSRTANPEVTINAEAGHSYALKLSTESSQAIVQVVDLGITKCRYEVIGKMMRGYTPVALKCE